MFSIPKAPTTATTVVPTSAAQDLDSAVMSERKRQAKKRGRAANVLSNDYMGATSGLLGG